MTFIEVHINEDGSVLEKLIKDAHLAIYRESLPSVGFGRVIVWNGRMFQELQLPKGADLAAPSGRRKGEPASPANAVSVSRRVPRVLGPAWLRCTWGCPVTSCKFTYEHDRNEAL
jgi:hypothetical protein